MSDEMPAGVPPTDPLATIHWGPAPKLIRPLLDFDATTGNAYLVVPLLPAGDQSSGELKPRPYVIVVNESRRLCIPMAEAALNLTAEPLLFMEKSPFAEKHLRGFLAGTAEEQNPGDLFRGFEETFSRFLDFPQGPVQARVLSLWALLSYIQPLFDATPILKLSSNLPGSGKSKTMEVLTRLCHAALMTSSITPSSLARLVARSRPVLLIDEQPDNLSKDLRQLLLASYRRGASVIKCSPQGKRIESFDAATMVALSGLNDLDPVLRTRTIDIRLTPAADSEKGSLAVNDEAADWEALRAGAYSFCLTRWRDLLEVRVPEVGGLRNRSAEIWKPILTLAKYFDVHVPGLFDETAAFASAALQPRAIMPVVADADKGLLRALAAMAANGRPETVRLADVLVKFREVNVGVEPPSLARLGASLQRLGAWSRREHRADGQAYRLDYPRIEALAAQLRPSAPST